VAGFDICESSIVNAKANAAVNGLECCEYYCGKAEDTLPKFLATLPVSAAIESAKVTVSVLPTTDPTAAATATATTDGSAPASAAVSPPAVRIPALVAVVDPPRSGLHPNVLKALRRCARVDALVYVSCNPVTLFADLHKLTQTAATSKSLGVPFELEKVVAVDMFAHTEHVEVVVALRRRK
jgi:tRNA (uracil-5-)-methyltransferase